MNKAVNRAVNTAVDMVLACSEWWTEEWKTAINRAVDIAVHRAGNMQWMSSERVEHSIGHEWIDRVTYLSSFAQQETNQHVPRNLHQRSDDSSVKVLVPLPGINAQHGLCRVVLDRDGNWLPFGEQLHNKLEVEAIGEILISWDVGLALQEAWCCDGPSSNLAIHVKKPIMTSETGEDERQWKGQQEWTEEKSK
jgi:hypothetical protein